MDEKLFNHLSLFSGYEGFGLGLKLAGVPIRTVGYVEIDAYCQRLLQARIRDGFLAWAPILRDIRSADFRPMAGLVDIITAGFPCQPHSVAGKRRGANDERNLWPDTLRAIGEVGPEWALLENVSGILANGYAGTVVGQLSELGYDCKWGIVSAADVGANHLRKRWWVLAHAPGHLRWWESQLRSRCALSPGPRATCEDVADSERQSRTLRSAEGERQGRPSGGGIMVDSHCSGLAWSRPSGPEPAQSWADQSGWWAIEPPLDRVVDGCPNRVDQLRALGNGIVPAVVAEFLSRFGVK